MLLISLLTILCIREVTNDEVRLYPAISKENSKYGYKNKWGKFVIEPQFEEAYPFSYGLAKVKIDGKYGFIDYEGDMYIEAIYDDVSELKVNRWANFIWDCYFKAEKAGKWGVVAFLVYTGIKDFRDYPPERIIEKSRSYKWEAPDPEHVSAVELTDFIYNEEEIELINYEEGIIAKINVNGVVYFISNRGERISGF